jgi:hypothetical protein
MRQYRIAVKVALTATQGEGAADIIAVLTAAVINLVVILILNEVYKVFRLTFSFASLCSALVLRAVAPRLLTDDLVQISSGPCHHPHGLRTCDPCPIPRTMRPTPFPVASRPFLGYACYMCTTASCSRYIYTTQGDSPEDIY